MKLHVLYNTQCTIILVMHIKMSWVEDQTPPTRPSVRPSTRDTPRQSSREIKDKEPALMLSSAGLHCEVRLAC